MLPNLVTITILNWAKHNPKRDQKTYTWLRLSNDIISDPDLFGLTPEQKLVWIEILCQASKKNAETITLNLSQLEYVTGVIRERIESLLKFLLTKPIISIHDITLPPDVVTTTPTNERSARHETNVRTDALLAPVVASAPASNGLGKDTSLAIARYCELWKEKYNGRVDISGKAAGQIRTLVKDHGLKRTIEIIESFFAMTHRDFIAKRHDVFLILVNLPSISHFIATGAQITHTQLNQIDRSSTNKNAGDAAANFFMKKKDEVV